MQTLTLRGVRVHNLKGIDVDIPVGRLTVVTGVCGAGKSSLVFDTLYAEAQRRYLQSFSAYTRQFLERFDQPDAERIGDLPPAIAIRRLAAGSSPRVTVASLTEIDLPLRALFAGAGEVVCPTCGIAVKGHGVADVVAAVEAMSAGARGALAFPATPGPAKEQPGWLAALLEEGYFRLHAGGVLYRLGEQAVPPLSEGEPVWVVLDRFEVGKTPRERLTESIDAGLRRGQGRIGVLTDTNETVFDERHLCSECGRVLTAPTPRLFDWSDPLGACPVCHGAGVQGKRGERCPSCNRQRWNADALAVRVMGRTIADWHALPLAELQSVLDEITTSGPAVEQLQKRVAALTALNLDYLKLGDAGASLSDGAGRRVQLAAALTSNLVNVLYLIDEPTIGLHADDTAKLLDALRRLRDRGNTVVVIEHQRDVIAAADHVIDLGPDAGDDGGLVVYQGPPAGLATAAENPTSDYFSGRSWIETPAQKRKPTAFIKLSGGDEAPERALECPLGVLCVANAGHQALIERVFYPALCLAKKKKADMTTTAKVTGASAINDVILLDQAPLVRASRSNPATYLKIFDDIRTLFAEAVDAKIRNFGPGHFSFNQAGGRCETCEGQGRLTIDMQFLADVSTTCPECQGRRFRKEILDIKVRGRSIAEVLDLTVREAFRFFRAQPKIEKKLKVLIDVGLDYLRLGQAVETLAGGECQRLKLAGHLASSRKGGCLFLLIEPSAGLHPADVANLLECFERLLAAGHSLIAVDSDADVIRCADCVIEG